MAAEIPPYIPKLEHWYSRDGLLDVPYVALPTAKLLKGRGDSCQARFSGRANLHRSWRISRRTRTLLVSVKNDIYLERFWKYHRTKNLLPVLAKLGALGITVHNFSYFSDAPRPHTLYNQARMARCVERLSAAGIPVIPHLNAITRSDWRHWQAVLERFPDVRYVCKEFQTHNGNGDLDSLARLQEALRRPLHPIFVAGLRYAPRLRELFDKCTVIDSEPFMRSVKRRRGHFTGDAIRWEPVAVASGPELHELMAHNLAAYGDYATMRLTGRVPAQLSLLDIFERVAQLRAKRQGSPIQPTLWPNLTEPGIARYKEKQ